ncbi:MAG: septation protein A [Legionellaceae bacterium]|nr:septation protein A [Legionellaceae bacterium]HCA88923.1 septation protein A [Legionellales bacterium]|tara:strand:- start:1535 stop:2116 length:582 start_codon:yes stop_codon:yes gene_type:complete
MNFLFDFLPVVVFFIAYKFFGIYVATALAMLASLLQVVIHRLIHGAFEKWHLISFASIFILGSATLVLHDPVFIKWKPTGIYWFAAIALLWPIISHQKPFIQRMMEVNLPLPDKIWRKLNIAWIIFFILLGTLNIWVAFSFSLDTWVHFKLFGCSALTVVFVMIQAFYVSRHLSTTAPLLKSKNLEAKPTKDN